MIDTTAQRYKGTSPFQDSRLDRKTFFGRDVELRDLKNLLLAEDLVLLFAKSGMGKSSLINAGLMKPLRRLGFFPVVARVNETRGDLWGSVLDRIRVAAPETGVDCVKCEDQDPWDFFKKVEFWSETEDLLRPVLILDQFEELFTLQSPERRQDFTRRLAELIRGRSAADAGHGDRSPPRLKILLSLREDFLADLEELSGEIPAILHNRSRLGALTREGARDAIVEPARVEDDGFTSEIFSYREKAVEQIIAFLGKRRMGQKTIEVDEVEPVQLQLICQYVEDQVLQRQSAGEGGIEIADDVLQGERHMQRVLEGFYDRTVKAIGSGRTIRAVRKLCEKRLISPTGRRLTEDEEEIENRFKIPRERLRQLVDARLLRAEPRLGGTFYELSHDSLVEPILQSRAKRLDRRRKTIISAGAAVLALAALVVPWFLSGLRKPPPLTDSPQLLAILFREPPSADDPVLKALEDVRSGAQSLTRDAYVPDVVAALQRLLVFLGYSTGPDGGYIVDGSFNLGTVRGIAQFQLEHGIGKENLGEVLVRAVTEAERRRIEGEVRQEIAAILPPAAGDEQLEQRQPGEALPLRAALEGTEGEQDLVSAARKRGLSLDAGDRILEVVRRARSAYDWSGESLEDGLGDVYVTAETLTKMLEKATDSIEDKQTPFGALENSLTFLNALSGYRENIFEAEQIVKVYGGLAATAIEQLYAGADPQAQVKAEWVLAFIEAQSGGFPSSMFSQRRLAELSEENPRDDFRELRLLATFMGLGRIPGEQYEIAGAASPEEMFYADVATQVFYVARYLQRTPGLASIASKASPLEEDFQRFAETVGATQPETGLDADLIAAKFRKYRGREEEATQVATTLVQAIETVREYGPDTARPATLGESLLPVLSIGSTNYAEDFQRILSDRLSDPQRLGEPAVRAIQRLLIFLGYSTATSGAFVIDGDFSAGLNRGIAQFRHEHGLADLTGELTYPTSYQAAEKTIGVIPRQPLDARTLRLMLSSAEKALAQGEVPYGGREAALFFLNSLERRQRLDARAVLERYGAAAEIAEKETGTLMAWTLAIIEQETSGVPRPLFHQHLMSRFYERYPDTGFVELRLRATAMGLGSIVGFNHEQVGAPSAEAMFMAGVDEQVLYVARFLAAQKEIVSKAYPSGEDFRAVARFYNGPGYEAQQYHKRLKRWFWEFRDLTDPSMQRQLNVMAD